MLTAIAKEEIPSSGRPVKSPLRRFAHETLAEFMETSGMGDFAEVTGWPRFPAGEAADEMREAEKVRAALSDEAFSMGIRDEVRRFRRRGRVFLQRVAAPEGKGTGR